MRFRFIACATAQNTELVGANEQNGHHHHHHEKTALAGHFVDNDCAYRKPDADGVNKEYGVAMAQAFGHQAMVKVGLVGFKDGLVGHHTADNRKERVKNWNTQG